MRRASSGFTLLELAIVLSIIGAIISGIWIYAAQANESIRLEKFTSQTVRTIMNAKRVFANATFPDTLANITDGAVTAGIFPAEMVTSDPDNRVLDAYNNKVTLSYTAKAGTSGGIYLTFEKLSQNACVSILTKLIGTKSVRQQSGLLGIKSLGTYRPITTSQEITISDLVSECSVQDETLTDFSLVFER